MRGEVAARMLLAVVLRASDEHPCVGVLHRAAHLLAHAVATAPLAHRTRLLAVTQTTTAAADMRLFGCGHQNGKSSTSGAASGSLTGADVPPPRVREFGRAAVSGSRESAGTGERSSTSSAKQSSDVIFWPGCWRLSYSPISRVPMTSTFMPLRNRSPRYS